MTDARKDAGEARQRPRPKVILRAPAGGRPPAAHPAGIAPTFEKEARAIVPRAGPHKGMITNPWVKYWTGQGPAPIEERAAEARATPARSGTAAREAGAAPRQAERKTGGRQSVDAGRAPERGRAKS
jgi:hypothetical protein